MFQLDTTITSVREWIFLALLLLTLGIEAFALIDALARKKNYYPAAGKRTKTIWLAILALGLALSIAVLAPLNFLSIAGFIAASVYLVDVRPALMQVGGGQGGGRGSRRSDGW